MIVRNACGKEWEAYGFCFLMIFVIISPESSAEIIVMNHLPAAGRSSGCRNLRMKCFRVWEKTVKYIWEDGKKTEKLKEEVFFH